jgi:hypothetical protein
MEMDIFIFTHPETQSPACFVIKTGPDTFGSGVDTQNIPCHTVPLSYLINCPGSREPAHGHDRLWEN